MLRQTSLLVAALCICTASSGADTQPAADSADQQLSELISLYIGNLKWMLVNCAMTPRQLARPEM